MGLRYQLNELRESGSEKGWSFREIARFTPGGPGKRTPGALYAIAFERCVNLCRRLAEG